MSGAGWLPSRMVLSSHVLRPTGHFHTKISDYPNICNGSNHFHVMSHNFLSDGNVVASIADDFRPHPYACADNFLIDGYVDGMVALICDDDTIDVVPKCCEERHVYDFQVNNCIYDAYNFSTDLQDTFNSEVRNIFNCFTFVMFNTTKAYDYKELDSLDGVP